jgi:DNA-binding Xre family transcriptional regulator
MVIYSKINDVLKEKGVGVEELIEKTGLTRMTIYNVRQGRNVTILTALKISEALGVNLEDIWSTEPDDPLEQEVHENSNLSA